MSGESAHFDDRPYGACEATVRYGGTEGRGEAVCRRDGGCIVYPIRVPFFILR